MNLFLLIPAIVLLVLGITRGVRRDWKWSILCLALGATLFVVHHRRLVASAKTRAREYRIEKDKVELKRNQSEEGNTSNNGLEFIGTNAPKTQP